MTLKLKNREPGRNEPCPCKSGLKYKHCHGDLLKREVCNRVANETMVQLILQEKRKKGIPIELICPDCNQEADITRNCEFCNRTGVVTKKQVKEKYDKLTKED
ncbi:MAG TPA: hypothetical protein ENH82_16705 [bacterium]|nr:hypothetical protein [bacterium]